MKFKFCLFFLVLPICNSAYCQEATEYAKYLTKTLSSNQFLGRGYTKNGAVKAAKWIAKEMNKIGLENAVSTNFLQPFQMPVNTIQSAQLKILSQKFKPGIDFIVNADAQKCQINHIDFLVINEFNINDSAFRTKLVHQLSNLEMANQTGYILDTLSPSTEKKQKNLIEIIKSQRITILLIKQKLTYTVATHTSNKIQISLLRNAIKNLKTHYSSSEIRIAVKNNFVSNSMQYNVVGMVRGSLKPDSFVVVCAHYDHLGTMDKAIFNGANDNAAGVAMVLELAKYYKSHPHPYTLVFIAFGGEEAGLLGSAHYVKTPMHKLNQTRFVMNLDLVGTGADGGTVVNASVFTKEFQKLDSLNKSKNYLPKLVKRNKAANSDHYYFTEMGIPSFFIYLHGARPAYHDVFDIYETLSMEKHQSLQFLIKDFFQTL